MKREAGRVPSTVVKRGAGAVLNATPAAFVHNEEESEPALTVDNDGRDHAVLSATPKTEKKARKGSKKKKAKEAVMSHAPPPVVVAPGVEPPPLLIGRTSVFWPLHTKDALRWRAGRPTGGLAALQGTWHSFAFYWTACDYDASSVLDQTEVLQATHATLTLSPLTAGGLLPGRLEWPIDLSQGGSEPRTFFPAGWNTVKAASLLIASEPLGGAPTHPSLPAPARKSDSDGSDDGDEALALLPGAVRKAAPTLVSRDWPLAHALLFLQLPAAMTACDFTASIEDTLLCPAPWWAQVELLSTDADVPPLHAHIVKHAWREVDDVATMARIEAGDPTATDQSAPPLRLRRGDMKLTVRWARPGEDWTPGYGGAYLLRRIDGPPPDVGPPAAAALTWLEHKPRRS